tara:strand:- start:53 stop:190 length:138 start_codon:yes stop_codon:yes gene_type:complete
MKESCCDKQKPKGSWKVFPLAVLCAVGTLGVLLTIEVGVGYALGL